MSKYTILCDTLSSGYANECDEGLNYLGCKEDCTTCEFAQKNYSEFTEKKQIELTKLIINAPMIDEISSYFNVMNELYVFDVFFITEFSHEKRQRLSVIDKDYAQTIAGMTAALVTQNYLAKDEVIKILEEK